MQVHSGPLVRGAVALDPGTALPPEWDAWAEEPAHQVVLTEDDTVVGAVHVALVSAEEAWLEGVRVRADRQGQGIGRRLVAEAEALARRYGAGVARTAVPVHEYAAQAVAERAGYRPVTRAQVRETRLGAGPIDVPYDAHVRPARPEEAAAIARRLQGGETLRAWAGLTPLGWRFRTLLVPMVKGLARDGRVLRTGEPAGPVEGAALFALHRDAAVVCLVDGPPSHVAAMLGVVAERARAQQVHRLVVFTPEGLPLPRLDGEWTPHPWCPDGLLIVSKEL